MFKRNLQVQLERVAHKWGEIGRNYNKLSHEIVEIAGEGTDTAQEISNLNKKLQGQIEKLQSAANHPELVIAATGTTSSGKSTLLNALIGAELLPSGVQEMSAGAVTIKHGHGKIIHVLPTQGAKWKTGQWENQSAADIRNRIKDCIEKFREAEQEDPTIQALSIEVTWPTTMGNEAGFFGLPDELNLSLIDLPGLNSVDDKRNSPVITEQISRAFCLIVYNSEETDSVKQKQLVDQVCKEICALRDSSTSLKRMSILLNRIDAFSREGDENGIKEFKEKIRKQVQDSLESELPEAKEEIRQINLLPLSSLPAGLAITAQAEEDGSDAQNNLIEALQGNVQFAPKKDQKTLRKFDAEDCTQEERSDFFEKVLEFSHFHAFKKHLAAQISKNLPTLVIGRPVGQTAKAARDIIKPIDAFKTSVNADKEKLEKLLEDLNLLERELHQLAELAMKTLSSASQKKVQIRTITTLQAPLYFALGQEIYFRKQDLMKRKLHLLTT